MYSKSHAVYYSTMFTVKLEQGMSLFAVSGFCIGFAAILVKMGRIYYIFSNPSINKKVSIVRTVH